MMSLNITYTILSLAKVILGATESLTLELFQNSVAGPKLVKRIAGRITSQQPVKN